jgi:DNA-binding winged helix-turn-helix (wHTH) protein/Flp pilus assembly protein TadD
MIGTYRFGPFELDPRTAELRRDGEPVPLQLQPARILVLLVERAGELVPREEIRALVWPDRVVDYEHGLNYAIRQIRSALGDDADAPVYLETLPRRGYRFAAPVQRRAMPDAAVARPRRLLPYALAGLALTAGMVATVVAPGAVDSRPPPASLLPPRDPGAREAFLVGRGLLPGRDRGRLERAAREFERVLRIEADHPGALVGLGEALLRMGRGGEARRPLERAIRLAPDDPQAHHLLAQVLLFHDWEWEAAERHLERAMQLRPGHAATYQVRAYWLALTGRMNEALAAMATALRLDPLSSYVLADAGWISYWAGHLDAAAARCSRTLELDPESGSARTCLFFSRIAQGDGRAARESARALMLSHRASLADLASIDSAPVEAGLQPYWAWEVRRLQTLTERSPHDAFLLALAHAQLGRRDEAFRELEAARRGRTSWMLWLEVEPLLGPLREDPRWAALVRRMNYPRSLSP